MFGLSTLRTRFVTLALLVFVSSILAACGGDNGSSPATTAGSPTAGASSGSGATVNVTLSEFKIDPSTINVAAGHVTFNVSNTGKYPHNFGVVVNGQDMKTKTISPGGSDTLQVDLTAGTYDTLCDIPTHKDKGMAGSIVVK